MARQGELFESSMAAQNTVRLEPGPPLLADQLLSWQERVADHQAHLFAGECAVDQPDLLNGAADGPSGGRRLNPLELQAQPLSFWRWPQAQVHGPALYFVLDRPPDLNRPLLLYIGETARAEQRWKGEHDCKAYLAAYGDALQQAGLSTRLSISFCCDVPAQTRPRRALELALIRSWLPPFNKETRERWATPFQAEAT